MIVFSAELCIPYDVGELLGIFSSVELAEKRIEKEHVADREFCVIKQWEVDIGEIRKAGE